MRRSPPVFRPGDFVVPGSGIEEVPTGVPEHEIQDEHDWNVPDEVREGLLAQARTAVELGSLVEDLHRRVHGGSAAQPARSCPVVAADAPLEQRRSTRRGGTPAASADAADAGGRPGEPGAADPR